MQTTGLEHGARWAVMFDEDGENKTWVNIASPSHQAIKLLNGTPLLHGSALRGREIRRTPPHRTTPYSATPHCTVPRWNRLHSSSIKTLRTSNIKSCLCQPCKARPPRSTTSAPFEQSSKFCLTPQGNDTTPTAPKCEQRKLDFCEEVELPDGNDSVRLCHPSKNRPRI